MIRYEYPYVIVNIKNATNGMKYTYTVVKNIPYNITCKNVTRNKNNVMSIMAFLLMKTGPGFD